MRRSFAGMAVTAGIIGHVILFGLERTSVNVSIGVFWLVVSVVSFALSCLISIGKRAVEQLERIDIES